MAASLWQSRKSPPVGWIIETSLLYSSFDRLYIPGLTDLKPTEFAPLGRNQVHRAGEAGVEGADDPH